MVPDAAPLLYTIGINSDARGYKADLQDRPFDKHLDERNSVF